MRLEFARRALSTLLLLLMAGAPALAQTRDEIREQNQQLYQQYQQNGPGDGSAVAPPIGGDATGSAPEAAPAGGGSGGGGNLVVQLLDRVNRLEEQNRQLSGRVDELERGLQTQSASLNKQIGDLSFAMQQGHPGGAAAGGDAMPAAPVAAASPPPLPRNARVAKPAASVAATPPPGPRGTGQAYKIAAGYTAAGNYRQAALAYYDVYNRQPRGPLAPDALLHVGSSMIALGQNGAACEALAKVHAEFPAARGNVARSASVLRARARC